MFPSTLACIPGKDRNELTEEERKKAGRYIDNNERMQRFDELR